MLKKVPFPRATKSCLIPLLAVVGVSVVGLLYKTSSLRNTLLTKPSSSIVGLINRLNNINDSAESLRNVSKTDCSNFCRTKFDPAKGYPAMAINAPCPDFVGAHTFRDLSDYVHYYFAHEDKGVTVTTDLLSAARCLGPVPIVYSLTDYDQVIKVVHSFSKLFNDGFILVTGASDYPAPNALTLSLLENENLLHWFGQNPDYEHPKFSPIPIGIACVQHAQTLEADRSEILDIHSTTSLRKDHTHFKEFLKMTINSIATNKTVPLLAVNFGITHPMRLNLKKHYCVKDFVTCYDRVMMAGDPRHYDVAQTYRQLSSVPFWLSPPGNGLDCYRTYEALYLHRVPVVQTSLLDPIYSKLPVVIVDDLFNITQTFLLHTLRDMAARTFSYEALDPGYWRRVIEDQRTEHIRRRGIDVASYRQRRRCWAIKANGTLLH